MFLPKLRAALVVALALLAGGAAAQGYPFQTGQTLSAASLNAAFANAQITGGTISGVTLTNSTVNVANLTGGTVTGGTVTATGPYTAAAYYGPFTYGALAYQDTGALSTLVGSTNGYVQQIVQNTVAGTSASADYIVNNDLSTATTYYGDFGINSSLFSGTGSLNLPSATYLSAASGDLALGTVTANAIHFVTNSSATDALTIAATGAISTPNQITFTLTTGTPPFVVASTTPVTNLSIGGNAATATTATNLTGGTVAATTLSASGAVSGAGFSSYLASPPAIGGTAAAAGTFTTVTQGNGAAATPTDVFTGAATTGTYWANPGIGFSVAAASVGTMTATGLNNMAVGATTASTGKFTTLTATGAITPTYPAGVVGNATGSAVSSGSVGQQVTSQATSANLTAGTPTNITSITIPAGDWTITASVYYNPAGTTTTTQIQGGISATSATMPALPNFTLINTAAQTGLAQAFALPTVYVTTAATYYCVGLAGFTVSTANMTCTITAIRNS